MAGARGIGPRSTDLEFALLPEPHPELADSSQIEWHTALPYESVSNRSQHPGWFTVQIGGARSVSIHRPLRVPAVFKAAVAPGYFTLQSDGKLTRVSYDPEI
jgi:hypothetical protein